MGAVATQSVVEPAFGPRGLDLMRDGASAPDAVRRLLEGDPQPEVRQVALVDAAGHAAAHTGDRCIAEAGQRLGEQVSAQANIMARSTVPDAMVAAYETARGDLAAPAAGGPARGRGRGRRPPRPPVGRAEGGGAPTGAAHRR